MKLVHLPLMGGLVHLVQRGGDWAGPHVICNATDVTAHPSIASVPIIITVLLYFGSPISSIYILMSFLVLVLVSGGGWGGRKS